jgi:hypothetical protein
MIEITEHICLRFIERFNPQLNTIEDYNERMNRAKMAVKSILSEARYLSDDDKGILMFSEVHNCYLIIKKKRLITLYPRDEKAKRRGRMHGNE